MKRKIILLISMIMLLLCGCGKEDEEENQYVSSKKPIKFYTAWKNDNDYHINYIERDSIIESLIYLEEYDVSISTDMKELYYDVEDCYIEMPATGVNYNECGVTMTAEAKVNGRSRNVKETDFIMELGAYESTTDMKEDVLRIYLEDGEEEVKSIEIVFEIESEDGLYIKTEPCYITGFEELKSRLDLETAMNVEEGSADTLVGEETIQRLEEEERAEQEAYEREVEAVIAEQSQAFIGEGNKQVGNERLGYVVIPEEYEEVINENENIEYRYEDEMGSYTVSIYEGSMDMSEFNPYNIYVNSILESCTSVGGYIEYIGGTTLKEERIQGKDVVVAALLGYMMVDYNSETPLTIVGTMESPYDASKVIVVECKYSTDSEMNREQGIGIMNKYRHSYYGLLY